MNDAPDTRHSLIVRLRDRTDQQAWLEFAAVYEPVVYRLARRRGLQHADALDLTQNVLSAVAGAIERWDPDPARGKFRGWLYRIAKNLSINALTRGHRHVGSGDTAILDLLHEQAALDGPDAALFELEYRREAFSRAADRVREEVQPATWQAFWLTGVEGRSIEEAGRSLGLSAGSVYAARSRVLARLRRTVEELEGE